MLFKWSDITNWINVGKLVTKINSHGKLIPEIIPNFQEKKIKPNWTVNLTIGNPSNQEEKTTLLSRRTSLVDFMEKRQIWQYICSWVVQVWSFSESSSTSALFYHLQAIFDRSKGIFSLMKLEVNSQILWRKRQITYFLIVEKGLPVLTEKHYYSCIIRNSG